MNTLSKTLLALLAGLAACNSGSDADPSLSAFEDCADLENRMRTLTTKEYREWRAVGIDPFPTEHGFMSFDQGVDFSTTNLQVRAWTKPTS